MNKRETLEMDARGERMKEALEAPVLVDLALLGDNRRALPLRAAFLREYERALGLAFIDCDNVM